MLQSSLFSRIAALRFGETREVLGHRCTDGISDSIAGDFPHESWCPRSTKCVHSLAITACFLILGGAPHLYHPSVIASPAGFVNDFRLNSPHSTSPFPVFAVAADSLGNFYFFWRDDEATGRAYLQKRRREGSLVWEQRLDAHGFDFYTSYLSARMAPDNNRVLLGYSGQTYPAGKQTIAAPATRQGFVVMYDSLGNRILGPVWVDSILGPPSNITSGPEACFFTGHGGFSVVERQPAELATNLYLINFDSAGNLLDDPIVINDCQPPLVGCGSPQFIKGEQLPTGGFVVTWDGLFRWGVTPQNSMGAPFYRVFNSSAVPVSQTLLTTLDSSADVPCYLNDSLPFCGGNNGDVAAAEDGSFLIGWQSDMAIPSGWIGNKVVYRLFAPDGSPLTPMILASDAMSNQVSVEPNVGYGNGHFYLIWTDSRNSGWLGQRDVLSQKVDRSGLLVGPNYRLNDIPFSPDHRPYWHGVANLGDKVLTIWDDERDMPEDGHGLYAQITPDTLFGIYWPGDAVVDYAVNSSDVIAIVNYIFKSGAPPMGGAQYADVGADCRATAADIIQLVNYVFKSGPPPLPPCE